MSQEPTSDPVTGLEEKLVAILIADVIASHDRQRVEPSQQNNRDLVRTIFAAIEGLNRLYRDHIVEIAKGLEVLDSDQEAVLTESGFQVMSDGKISKYARFVPLPSMFRLVTRIAGKIDPTLKIRFDTGEWDRFLAAVAIRNRVTHPKIRSDLSIAPAELEKILDSLYWIFETISQAMQSANRAFAGHVRLARELLDALKAGDPNAHALYQAAITEMDE